jgi:hypothetical protein
MLRRLFASVIVLGSAVVLSAPSANAQSVNVPFTVSVGAVCSFNPPTTGTLVLSGANVLVANSSTGTRGSVGFNCSAPANIIVGAPIQTAGPALTPTICSSTISITGTGTLSQSNSCNGSGSPGAINGSNTLTVSMRVESPSAISPGDYAYNVALTIVP